MNLKKFKYINVDVLIGEKTTLTGNLDTESAVKIDGVVCGNITSSKEVILSETATVKGDIFAGSLIIAGSLVGNVSVKEQLIIKSSGSLEGNAETGALVIEEGGCFSGMNHSIIKEETVTETMEE